MSATARPNQAKRNARAGLDPALPRLLGDQLCLDFANSIEEPAGPERRDFLQTYPDLVRWGRHVGLLSTDQATCLLDEAERRPAAAAAALEDALALRTAIDRAFHQIARGAVPDPTDLATVQRAYLDSLTHARLMSHPTGEGFDWIWQGESPHLDRVVWPVAHSAVELLTRGDLRRVKECPLPDGCTWLFYDRSKNASRRWCSMEGCGTRVKMRRYHARQRAAKRGDARLSEGES